MDDIKRIKEDILKQVFACFEDFSQDYVHFDDYRYFSPEGLSICLSPSDYSILKDSLYGR